MGVSSPVLYIVHVDVQVLAKRACGEQCHVLVSSPGFRIKLSWGLTPCSGDFLEYLQAKRRLLYNFNKSSSFSDIFDSCLLKLSLQRSSAQEQTYPTGVFGGASDQHPEFGGKGFLSWHRGGSHFFIAQEMSVSWAGTLSACRIMYLCRFILFF